jgi:hypothetical protein
LCRPFDLSYPSVTFLFSRLGLRKFFFVFGQAVQVPSISVAKISTLLLSISVPVEFRVVITLFSLEFQPSTALSVRTASLNNGLRGNGFDLLYFDFTYIQELYGSYIRDNDFLIFCAASHYWNGGMYRLNTSESLAGLVGLGIKYSYYQMVCSGSFDAEITPR